ncbi:MAG: acyclic terpene utilization AtuA family protein [Pyrinomonadaceae bacterium]|nr:acyclic terpene utilization AtuA family protein [Pyrinomonadaceae bacterium]
MFYNLFQINEKVIVASGQGFWGDMLSAPVDQVRRGPIDYLMLDYLAEVTMSIMQKQRQRNPEAGYARDFVSLMQEILPDIVEKDIKVLSNAGGVNVAGCAEAIRDTARELGLGGKLKIGVVTGDDVLPRLDEFLDSGIEINSMDTGEPLANIRDKVQAANVYLGASGLVEALGKGAQVVVGGRLTDTGLTLAPLMHEFGWTFEDWDLISAGTIAGHIIECGAQSSGGNCQYDWKNIPNLADVGFPIVEATANGEFVITKHEGTGGRVNIQSIKEQLVYEMGDPKAYITPDVVADFSTIQLADDGPDRVRVYGIKGNPNTEFYKVSIAYSNGWKSVGTLVYSWPEAYEKAKAADRILRERLDRLALKFDVVLSEFVGVNATHGHLTGEPSVDIPEVQFRIGVRGQNKADIERFTKEIAPLILTGPPAVTGFAGGRPKVEEIMAYFPALIPKHLIETKVDIVEA